MDEYVMKIYVVHGCWNLEETDGSQIFLVTREEKKAIDMLDTIAENRAEEYVTFPYEMEVSERTERLYELQDTVMAGTYGRFGITEMSMELDDDFLEKIYRVRQKQYQFQDVRNAINDAYEWEQIAAEVYDKAKDDAGIIKLIADRFDATEDCNRDFNATMNDAVRFVLSNLEQYGY